MPSRTTKVRLLGLAFGAAALPGLVLVTAGNAIAAPGSPSGARPTPVPASLKTVDKAGSLAPALRGAKDYGQNGFKIELAKRTLVRALGDLTGGVA